MAKIAKTQLIYIWIGGKEAEQCRMYIIYVRINTMKSLDKMSLAMSIYVLNYTSWVDYIIMNKTLVDLLAICMYVHSYAFPWYKYRFQHLSPYSHIVYIMYLLWHHILLAQYIVKLHAGVLTMILRSIGAIKAHTTPLSGGSQQLRVQSYGAGT